MVDRQTDASKLKSNTFGKKQEHNQVNIENVNVLTISMHWYIVVLDCQAEGWINQQHNTGNSWSAASQISG